MRRISILLVSLIILTSEATFGQTAESVLNNYFAKTGGKSKISAVKKITSTFNASMTDAYGNVTNGLVIHSVGEYPNKSKVTITWNGQPLSGQEYDGVKGFMFNNGVRTQVYGAELEEMKYNSLFLPELYSRQLGVKLQFLSIYNYPVNYRDYYQIQKTLPNGKVSMLYYDVETGLLAQEVDEAGTSYTQFANYNYQQGILVPHTVTFVNPQSTIVANLVSVNFETSSVVANNDTHVSHTDSRADDDEGLDIYQSETNSEQDLSNVSVKVPKNEKRIALVIGNADYRNGGELKNPLNDARAMAKTLRQLGFEVMTAENTSQADMKKAIDQFGRRMEGYDIGLFYYAGHGIQSKGKNYMIPIEADLQNEQQVEYDCIAADRVLAFMDHAGSRVNIIILDACRNNPFERSWSRSGSGNGLAFMNAPTGSIIAYATSPGNTASDGDGQNGLYTEALLKHMKSPGLTIEQVFKKVRGEVEQRSGSQQTPWESTSLKGDFYFNPDN
ncbi:MAG: caspase family protein [Bacteroidota bacterium]